MFFTTSAPSLKFKYSNCFQFLLTENDTMKIYVITCLSFEQNTIETKSKRQNQL